MKSYQIIIITAILLGFILSGCTERFDFEPGPDGESRLVVDARLTNETKAHYVHLSESVGYFDNSGPKPVSGASVRITGGGETFVLSETSPGIYLTSSNVKGIPGTIYTLTIDWDGKIYRAVSTMSDVPPLEKTTFRLYEEQDDDNDYQEFSILVNTTDPAASNNYYYWKSFPVHEPNNIKRTYWQIAEDQFIDGSRLDEAEVMVVEANEGEVFIFEQYGINEETYDFYLAVQSETIYKGGLFDTPPANIPTNIDNDAIGFFITTAVERDTVTFR